MFLSSLCCVLVVGCGESADPAGLAGPVEAGAVVSGSVEGEGLEPRSVIASAVSEYSAGRALLESDHTAVAITDLDGACGYEDAAERTLYIDLFGDTTQPNAEVTGPGLFQMWTPKVPGADDTEAPATPPSSHAWVTYRVRSQPGTVRIHGAQSGRVVITDVSSDLISGTFDVTFNDGQLAGSFDAAFCEPWVH